MIPDLGFTRKDLISNKQFSDERKKEIRANRVKALELYIQKKKETLLGQESILRETKVTTTGSKIGEEVVKGQKIETNSSKQVLKYGLPSVSEFACAINSGLAIIYVWAKEDNEFKTHLENLEVLAEISIKNAIDKGLMTDVFGKFLLSARHNYREKSDITTNDKEILFSNEHKEKTDNAITDFLTKENEKKTNTPANT